MGFPLFSTGISGRQQLWAEVAAFPVFPLFSFPGSTFLRRARELVCLGGTRANSGCVARLRKVCPFCEGRSRARLSRLFLAGEYRRSVVTAEMSCCWAAGGSPVTGEKTPEEKNTPGGHWQERLPGPGWKPCCPCAAGSSSLGVQRRHRGSRGSCEAALGQMHFGEEIRYWFSAKSSAWAVM